MTPSEFKAWFDGFTEALDSVPSKDQWARIKKRVSQIDGRPVTERVFVDRYIDRYWPQYIHQNWQTRILEVPLGGYTVTCGSEGNSSNGLQYQVANEVFNSHQAMCALGRAEAASIS